MAEEGLVLQSSHKFEIDTTPGAVATYAVLGAGLNNFEPSPNEELSQDNYLDGEGFSETEVTGAQLVISFSGHRKIGDPAQDFIFSKLLSIGKGRKTNFRWTLPNDDKFEGPCTIANIEGPGGDANAKGEISFEIHFNGLPTFTAAP